MIRGFAIGGVIFWHDTVFFPPQQICCKDQCVYFEENTWHCRKDNRFCDKTFSKDWQENHKFLCKQLKKWIKMIKMSLCKL